MKYKKTEKADDDLIDIYLYGFIEFGEPQAEKYFAELTKTFSLIAENPYIAKEDTNLYPPVRIHQHVSHQIVYSIEEDFILIIRILHKSMLPSLHL